MMILFAKHLLAAAAAATSAQAVPPAAAELAKALKDRVAGEAVDCITLSSIHATEIYDHFAILYTMEDGMRYVNRPASGLGQMESSSVMVTDTHSPRLCSVDFVKLVDSSSRSPRGVVELGKFIPWRKP